MKLFDERSASWLDELAVSTFKRWNIANIYEAVINERSTRARRLNRLN